MESWLRTEHGETHRNSRVGQSVISLRREKTRGGRAIRRVRSLEHLNRRRGRGGSEWNGGGGRGYGVRGERNGRGTAWDAEGLPVVCIDRARRAPSPPPLPLGSASYERPRTRCFARPRLFLLLLLLVCTSSVSISFLHLGSSPRPFPKLLPYPRISRNGSRDRALD